MTFTYRVAKESDGYVAECLELDASGTGRTVGAAVQALREALEEHLFRPDAVAPPPSPFRGRLELVESSAAR